VGRPAFSCINGCSPQATSLANTVVVSQPVQPHDPTARTWQVWIGVTTIDSAANEVIPRAYMGEMAGMGPAEASARFGAVGHAGYHVSQVRTSTWKGCRRFAPNVLLIGPPGAGKSRLARWLPTILPHDDSGGSAQDHRHLMGPEPPCSAEDHDTDGYAPPLTVAGVLKELTVFVLIYHLIRMIMLQSAAC
jgi:hypothetical protein